MKKLLSFVLGAAATFALSAPAFAVGIQCSDKLKSGLFADTEDVSLTMSGVTTYATSCAVVNENFGKEGKNLPILGSALDTQFGGGSFVQVGKLDKNEGGPTSANSAFAGLAIELAATGTNGKTTGTWALFWTGDAATLDLVLAIHAGGYSGLFFFDDLQLDANSSGKGTWKIEWPNSSGKNPGGFSNMTVWSQQGETSNLPIPEPGALALLGLGGIIAAVSIQRRRES